MLKSHPLALVILLCMSYISVGVIAALVCQENEECSVGFSLPLSALSSVICVVILFALFYVEMGGHRGGGGMANSPY